MNIWRKRVHVESYLGEGVRVTLCLRSLATQGGLVNTRNVATERLAKSDKLIDNFSFRKIDRQLGFRSCNVRIGSWFALVRTVIILTSLQPLEKITKLKQKTKSEINLNSLRDGQLNAVFSQRQSLFHYGLHSNSCLNKWMHATRIYCHRC